MTAWEQEDVVIGVVREETNDDGQAPPVSKRCFQSWMDHAQRETSAGDVGYPIGRRVLDVLTSDFDEDDSADLWNLMRKVVAGVFDKNAHRMATMLPQDILSVALCARGILDLGLPQTFEPQDIIQVLGSQGGNIFAL